MPLCTVITCKYSQDDVDPALDGIVFHRFPKNEEMRAKWIDMTGHDIRRWMPSSKDVICSRHFRDNDYFIKRSGKRYLKTAAIPCEYVVYRHLFPDEEVTEVKAEPEAEASEAEEVPVHEEQEPKVVVQHEPEVEFEMTVDPQPGPSHWFLPQTSRASSSQVLPDSTIATIFDNENSREWERFQPERYFGHRLPASIFEDNSQEVDSSGFDERFRREEGSVNPYPPELDLRPHLQLLPPPRTPEPVIPIMDDTESNLGFEEEQVQDAPSPVVEIMRGRKKLEDIRKIMTKRKSSKRRRRLQLRSIQGHGSNDSCDEPPAGGFWNPEVQLEPLESSPRQFDSQPPAAVEDNPQAVAAAFEEVLEAKKANEQLQSGQLSDHDKALALIALQTKRIIKLDMKHRRLKKILKRISAVLRKTE
ncbi:hypothetical protein PYW08_009226 [Mythimna loreyi]|uniref:Uncharacterized protein n=1 Tax=Mythimna loreyi TaxID=667449 RepID=A0ACC2Q8V2_9NEOP|nr:hypothetical protein PYW08_009226 [Mythimna loreyi]